MEFDSTPVLPRDKKIGLDAEALWWPYEGGSLPGAQLALCFSYGDETNLHYTVALYPGVFTRESLQRLSKVLSQPDIVVVGHNALKFDLPLLNGTLLYNGLSPLPAIRCQDTLNTLKMGRAYSNSLKAQCKRYGIQLKEDHPDWRKILECEHSEWNRMVEYCKNDVVCALQLERALAKRGIPCPIRTWEPRKG